MKYSLVIPCYNEVKNIPPLVENCKNLIRQFQHVMATDSLEIILVDNGSTDNSQIVFANIIHPQIRAVTIKENIGYGHGVISGLRIAQGDILSWTHADLQTNLLDLMRGFELMQKNGSTCYVKGRRYCRPFKDVIFTIGMSLLEIFLLKKFLWDINAQPNIFSKDFFSTWSYPPTDFSLDLYSYYQAKRQGVKVIRFSVYFGERIHGQSNWNTNWQGKRKFIQRTLRFSLELKKMMRR